MGRKTEMSIGHDFRPKVVGFLCNWCCYGGADLAGVSRFQYPPFIRVVRLMCSGRVDLSFIFRSFMDGADAVFIGGCHINDCHYNTEGNYDALSMTHLCKKLLERAGIDPKRLRLEWVSAGEGIRFAEVMRDFGKEIKKLGPLGAGEGVSREELKRRINEVVRLIAYIKLAKREKLALHDPDESRYESLYSMEEIDALFRYAPSYHIDPAKCQACMICYKKCPVEAIDGGKNRVHVIDQGKCIKCGTCFEACPPRFNAVAKIIGDSIPEAIPEGQRTIVRRK